MGLKYLEKTREIDNEARKSKKAEMKRKFNRNQKRITPWDIQLSCLTSLFKPSNLSRFLCIFFKKINIVKSGASLMEDHKS